MAEKLGRYEIVGELGRGGMGVVYKARDPVIGRFLALKTIKMQEGLSADAYAQFKERFIREAQAAGKLSHPNIVTIHDVGTDEKEDVSFIAMEFVPGKNLQELLDAGYAFSPEEAARIVCEIAKGLDYAHRNGIIHRDIKPANIILSDENQVKITDFGIARLETSSLTRTGQLVGTPHYMSPEQVTGGAVDRRTDIFSLGVVAYQLLTRERPFVGESLTTITYKIVHVDPVKPRELNVSVSDAMEYIILKAMSKDPAARFQTAREMAEEIEAYLSGGAAAGRTQGTGTVILGTSTAEAPGIQSTISLPKTVTAQPPGHPAPETRRSGNWKAALIVAACVVAVGIGAAFLIGGRKPSKPVSKPGETSEGSERPSPRAPTQESRPAEASEAESGAKSGSGPATITVKFDHHIVQGTLTIWMDGEKVLSCPLRAKKSKAIIPKLKLSHETIRRTLTVPAGDHTFQVNVYGTDPNVNETGQLPGRIRPGDRMSLVISVHRITNSMSLSWG